MPPSKQLALRVAKLLGRYEPFKQTELSSIQHEPAAFTGDIPANAGAERNQYRLEFAMTRPLSETVYNLLYTSRGMAWSQGTLLQRYSLQEPSVKDALNKPHVRGADIFEQGTIVQAETPYTYGDWVSEHLVCLTLDRPILEPLLMPQHLMRKSYIQRDLKALGIHAVSVDKPVFVKKAVVLRKPRPSHYWRDAEALAYRKAFNLNPCKPNPGSLIYLSREGEKSESQDRQYPNELVANVVQALGGKIVVTHKTSYEDYCLLAKDAETVIADHGGAMFNLLHWNTKNVIELFSDEWWTNCFLFLSKTLAISNYALLNVDRINASEFVSKLTSQIRLFQDPKKGEPF